MAIDQGTTGTRVILFNHAGDVHSTAYREIEQIFPQPGWVEHNPTASKEQRESLYDGWQKAVQRSLGWAR